MKYRILITLSFLLFLTACGGSENPAGRAPTGLYTDQTLEDHLIGAFEETKSCTGLEEGLYENLTVVMMPPIFTCTYYDDGCNGEYVTDGVSHTILLGRAGVWKHEVVHYLLYVNTGSADAAHDNNLFDNCEF